MRCLEPSQTAAHFVGEGREKKANDETLLDSAYPEWHDKAGTGISPLWMSMLARS